MIPAHWISALANHLWQSTLLIGVAALLTLALRKNHARTRYWLWLVASLKLLIPFSLLVGLGCHLEWFSSPPKARPELSVVIAQISQPFTQAPPTAAVTPLPPVHNASPLPSLALLIWVCGSLAVAILWWRRWRCIRAAMRAGSRLPVTIDIPVLSSPVLLEPGVFGIFHPVLLLPEGITDRLTVTQLETIIAHEMCHVRRRDNLTAAIHMGVEAIFWFHPLVWWLGARLVEERERACDEEVLRLGNEPEVYAESILRTCEFYLESPVACVSGITGSDLKKRIVRIMTRGAEKKLDLGRKLLLAAVGIAAVAGPVMLGLLNAPQSRAQSQPATSAPSPSFEVASIKLNHGDGRNMTLHIEPGGRFLANNVPVKLLLEEAYRVKDSQLSEVPSWVNSERYDIEAKPDDSAADAIRKLSPAQQKDQLMLMIQALLADRFKLTLRHDTKVLPVYLLVVAKSGTKFQETALTPADLAPPKSLPAPGGPPPKGGVWITGRGQLTLNGAGLDVFANALSMQLGRVVLDQTGLKAKYDFKLQWTPDDNQEQMFKGTGAGAVEKPPTEAAPPPDTSGPTIFTALQEQLGLKLESQKRPLDVLVIDHIERPSEN